VVLYFLGQTIALVGMGVASVWLGEALGFTSQDPRINLIVGVFLMLAGIIGLAGKIPFFQSSWNNSGLLRWLNSFDGYFAPLFVGLAAVLVMSPCTTPLLSTVLALTSTTESASWGMAAMVSYSVGFSAVVLALGFGLMSVRKMPRSGPWLNGIHYLGCAALLGAGVYFILQSR
jgi:cytochrome c biogenesis protein CcdA